MRERFLVLTGVFLILSLSVSALAAEPVTIRFFYRSGGTRPDVVRAWIAEFEAQNPDIRVEWEEAISGWQDKLLVSMAAGTAPDVVEFWGNFAQQLARKGFLLDLRDFVARDFTADDIRDFFQLPGKTSLSSTARTKVSSMACPGISIPWSTISTKRC